MSTAAGTSTARLARPKTYELKVTGLAALQYIGANSYLEQQKSANYNGTTSTTRAKYGWYPRVSQVLRAAHRLLHCCGSRCCCVSVPQSRWRCMPAALSHKMMVVASLHKISCVSNEMQPAHHHHHRRLTSDLDTCTKVAKHMPCVLSLQQLTAQPCPGYRASAVPPCTAHH
jgi:hypothetical protein